MERTELVCGSANGYCFRKIAEDPIDIHLSAQAGMFNNLYISLFVGLLFGI
jgi:hypothetical protein